MRIALVWLFLLLLQNKIIGQNTLGIPNIINYTKLQYNAGSQNWDIKQDNNGITYFANDDGPLTFDGTFWRIYTLPNKTIVRSLCIDNNRIYVGGQGEIGYFSPGNNGDLVYTSLNKLMPKGDNDFADVWNIILFNGDTYFRSNRKIFKLHNNKISVYNSINWGFLGSADGKLFAYDYTNGLVKYTDNQWQPFIAQQQLPANIQVSSLLTIGKDSLLLASLTNGVFIISGNTVLPYETPALKTIAAANIYGAKMLAQDKIVFITNLAGCFIVTKDGQLVQRISKQEGLQNNNILSIFYDKNENLWLGLDNGIDLIIYNNAIKNIYPENGDRNAGYTSIIYNHRLYLGTSTGVYTALLDDSKDLSFTKGSFALIPATAGQIWNLSEVNGKLLAGHNKGAFIINGTSATPVDNTTGFWTFQPLFRSLPSSLMIAGTYNGINFYKDSSNTFSNPGIHAHFESAKFVAIDSNEIWIAHPYKGLYCVQFDENGNPYATNYKDAKYILSPNHNYLFKVKNRIVLTNGNGIYEYNYQQKDFVPSAFFQKLFGKLQVTYLKEDQYGNIWFCLGKKAGVADMTGSSPKLIYFPELNNKIRSGDFENIYVADSNNVFIGAEKGFFHINYQDYKKHTYTPQALIRSVKTFNGKDNLIFGGYATGETKNQSIKYADNSLYFGFSSTIYGQEQTIEYSYYLEGFDKGWLGWTTKTEKDYTNLPAGKYVFKVRCRNSNNQVSNITTYSFEILPPWYQTWWAYMLYVILLAITVYIILRMQMSKFKRRQQRQIQKQLRKYEEEQWQAEHQHQLERERNEREIVQLKNEKLKAEIEQRNLEDEQKRMQLLHQIEVEKNERELVALRNEKLEIEIHNKNAQLASNAMVLVQRSELLQKIKDELIKLRKDAEIEKDSKDYKRIIKIIDNELEDNNEWEQFAVHFDSVHTDYLKNLKELYPNLTPSELKLCAYLRLNLTTKEIAQLMNVLVRGVETNRYRLRKKLNITNEETSLFDFLLNVNKIS